MPLTQAGRTMPPVRPALLVSSHRRELPGHDTGIAGAIVRAVGAGRADSVSDQFTTSGTAPTMSTPSVRPADAIPRAGTTEKNVHGGAGSADHASQGSESEHVSLPGMEGVLINLLDERRLERANLTMSRLAVSDPSSMWPATRSLGPIALDPALDSRQADGVHSRIL